MRRDLRGSASLLFVIAALAAIVFAVGSSRGANTAQSTRNVTASVERRRASREFSPEYSGTTSATSARLVGTIRDEARPLAAVAVTVVATPRNAGLFRNLPSRFTAITNADGAYALPLPVGTYDVSAAAAGHQPDYRRAVEVAPNGETRLDFTLKPGGCMVTGVVQDVAGGELANATVLALRLLNDLSPPIAFQVVTDEEGRYKFDVEEGLFSIAAASEGYATERKQVHVAGRIALDFALLPTATVSGRVMHADSQAGVAFAEVTAIPDQAAASYLPVHADETGVFSFASLEPGNYRLWARSEGLTSSEVAVHVSVAGSVKDVELRVTPGASVRGRVLAEDGSPVEDARVRLQSQLDARDRALTAETDARGEFALQGVPTGDTSLLIEGNEFAEHTRVLVVQPGSNTVDITLLRSIVVAGALRARAEDLRRGSLTLVWSADDGRRYIRQTTSNAAGEFSFANLAPGQGTLHAQLDGAGTGEAAISHVARGERRNVTIEIDGSNGAWARGSVRDPNGREASGIAVVGHQYNDDGAHMKLTTTTDAHGDFRIGPFRVGSVQLLASRNGGTSWGFGMPSHSKSRASVTLSATEERTGIELVVEDEDGELRGLVLDRQGSPVADALVTAAQEAEGPATRRQAGLPRTTTDEQGAFALSGLVQGKYTLWASAEGFADSSLEGAATGSARVELRLDSSVRITGKVVDAQGESVSDYTVQLFPAPEAAGVRVSINDLPMRRVHNRDGVFELSGLARGAYQLLVRLPDGRSGFQAVQANDANGELTVTVDARSL